MDQADNRFYREPGREPDDGIFAEWVVLELMGHRRLAGFLTEQEIAGRGFLRLEIPGKPGAPGATQLYNPTSVYAITPTTKEIAERVAQGCWPTPVQRWELERPEPVEGFPDEDGPF